MKPTCRADSSLPGVKNRAIKDPEIGLKLDARERSQLIAFLRTLMGGEIGVVWHQSVVSKRVAGLRQRGVGAWFSSSHFKMSASPNDSDLHRDRMEPLDRMPVGLREGFICRARMTRDG